MPVKLHVPTGTEFGRLKVVAELAKCPKTNVRRFKLRCQCGNERDVFLNSLRSGATKSCGCYNDEKRGSSQRTHGLSKTPLYSVWRNMKARCYNRKYKQYKDYGGRGIRVCKSWFHSFETFAIWAYDNGYARGLEIDRENNNRGYRPSNCRFVTHLVNSNNRRPYPANRKSRHA